MAEIKPIETVYNGYRFRSRLEAKWAVYFDRLRIKYEYEPEGYVFSDGTCYLPDFYLPQMETYVEIKPLSIKRDELEEAKEKMLYLANGKNKFGLLCMGDPVDNYIHIYSHIKDHEYIYDKWERAEFIKGVELLADDFISIYVPCDVSLVVGDRYDRKFFTVCKPNSDSISTVIPFNTVYGYDGIPYYEQEYARQARFEHGECG